MPLAAQAWAKARSTSAGVSLLLPFPEEEEEEDSRSPAARTSLEKRAPSSSAEAGDGVSGNAGIVVPERVALLDPEGRRAP